MLPATAGCNQVFGLHETGQIDAAYFDAPLDAPFACPGTDEVPHFSRVVNQIAQECYELTISSPPQVALGKCDLLTGYALSYGSFEQGLTPITAPIPSGYQLEEPRLVPEGDQFFTRLRMTGATRLVAYARSGTTSSWAEQLSVTVPGGVSDFIQAGVASAGPARRIMVLNGRAMVDELEVQPSGAATLVGSYTFAELGVASVLQVPNLSEDGLRILFAGERASDGRTTVVYNVRASLADRFTRPSELPELPRVTDALMTSDCSRVYFTGVQSIFWVQRQ